MTKDPPRINIPGLNSGGNMRGKIALYAAVPSDPDQSIILGWTEEGNDIMDSQMVALGSCCLSEYGLDNPPGKGIWVFEGEIYITFSRGGDPMEPQDHDSDLSWEGEWRPPTDEEMTKWRGFKATHTTYNAKEEDTRKCGGYWNNPKLEKPNWKVHCSLPRLHKGDHDFGPEFAAWKAEKSPPIVVAKPVVGRPHYTPRSSSNWCACGKHVSECCCGENHNIPHHHSGRAYDEEDYEQFDK
jgi:hypothetical protein